MADVTREDREAAVECIYGPNHPAPTLARWIDDGTGDVVDRLVIVAAAFAAHRLREREACARVVETYGMPSTWALTRPIAAAIRGRS